MSWKYRCPLGSAAPEKLDAERIKLEGWREQKILVVSVDDQRLDFVDREMIRILGEKLYGSKR